MPSNQRAEAQRAVLELLEARLLLNAGAAGEPDPGRFGPVAADRVGPSAGESAQSVFTSTHSFTNDARGAHPNTVTFAGGRITVDMSPLPAGTHVYRALFVHNRGGSFGQYPGSDYSSQPLRIESVDAPGVWLTPLAPRDYYIDCTAAAQRAIATPTRRLVLNLVSFAGFNFASGVRFDITCDQPTAHAVTAVSNISAMHRTGDTMVTFKEATTLLPDPNSTVAQYKAAAATFNSPNVVRYRIYRSSVPIDATTIRQAELVDEISPLSAWNPAFYGVNWGDLSTYVVPRLPVDNEVLAGVDTGIYVRRAGAAGSAYYAVSTVINGEEDLSTWTPGVNATAAPVVEAPGAGMALLRKKVLNTSFMYESNVNLYYYDRWECYPTYNRPSAVFDYLVGVPSVTVNPRPVDVALHCWGGSLEGGYGWWYEADKGALLLSTNMDPYDWWTGLHDNYGTVRPFTNVDGGDGGVVRDYAADRVLSFLDNVVKANWNVDDNRIILSGSSMGGAGAIMWGSRAADRFAYADGWVGVYIPRLTPTFKGSFEGVFGTDAWNCQYEDTGLSAFDYWDSARFISADPAQDVPYLCFANGKNDDAIGWPQAQQFVSALIAARQPFKFNWGQGGHGERAQLPGGGDRYIGLVIRRNQTLPAFTHCSLDNNMGNGSPTNGDASGQINGYLLWQTNNTVDELGQWALTAYLASSAPQGTCTVDVTPRRTQLFDLRAGTKVFWTNTSVSSGARIASGATAVDAYGLVTLPGQTVNKTQNRLLLRVSGDADTSGLVSFADYQKLEVNFGLSGRNWAQGDFDGDGDVDFTDYQALEANFGMGTSHIPGPLTKLLAGEEPALAAVCGGAGSLPAGGAARETALAASGDDRACGPTLTLQALAESAGMEPAWSWAAPSQTPPVGAAFARNSGDAGGPAAVSPAILTAKPSAPDFGELSRAVAAGPRPLRLARARGGRDLVVKAALGADAPDAGPFVRL